MFNVLYGKLHHKTYNHFARTPHKCIPLLIYPSNAYEDITGLETIGNDVS